MKILGIGHYNELSYMSTHWLGHVEAFKKLGHDFTYWHYDKNYIEEMLNKIKDINPDIVILGISDVFKGDFLEKLRPLTKAKIVWWYCDFTDYENFGDKDVIRRPVDKLIDYIFITNREQIPFYQNKLNIDKVYYLPQACLKREKIEELVSQYKNKLVFVGQVDYGGIRTERVDLLNYIRKNHPELKLYPNSDLTKKQSYGVHHLFYPSVEITLGHSWHNDADMYTSNRLFIVLGNGGFYLCNRFKNMEEMWGIGKHLDVFDNKEEAVEKIKYYQSHPKEREEIRKCGFEYVQKYHNYTIRLQNLLDIVNEKNEQIK